MKKRSELDYLKRRIIDINVNSPSYKREVIKKISLSKKITPIMKSRLLATAINIKSNSFRWNKSWDVGKIFNRRK